jgi:hypothetical protein
VMAKQEQTPLNDVAKLALLGALSKKYKRCSLAVNGDYAKKNDSNAALSSFLFSQRRREEVTLICHNAAHEIIRRQQEQQEGDKDQQQQQEPVEQVLDAALVLLVSVSTEPLVRRSYCADDGHLVEIVVQILQRARLRAKQYREPEMEQRAAEIQRRGCLLLGALVNNNRYAAVATTPTAMCQLILAKGGMRCIVDALDLFRCHEDVANWALWAIFTILFDHRDEDNNQSSSPSTRTNTNTTAVQHLLNANGGPVILAALENCGHHVGVASHGIAIFFHLVVAHDIPLPPVPVIRIVQQLLVAHHYPTTTTTTTTTMTTTNDDRTIPTNPDEMSHSARQQIALMGRDTLVRLQGIHHNTNQEE